MTTAPILVAYATRAGSTQSIAEAIGKTLSDGGLPVEVRPITRTLDPAPYRAVVAGSAIHGRWLPEAMQFIYTHRATLAAKPFAAFLVCISLGNPQYSSAGEHWMEPVRSVVRPICEGYFAGVLDFKTAPRGLDTVFLRLATAVGLLPQGDHRDWNKIRAWAESTGSRL